MPRDMSWLSPKRRRTTTAIPKSAGEDEGALSPSPRFHSPKPILPTPSLATRPSRTFSSASSTSASAAQEGEGNLFYAYARRADDLHSRFLLTFASAHVANEWWSLVQTHFPDTTRPGPQLFSFKTDDLLSKAWSHNGLAHLKPKWMYIQIDDSTGGTAQGVIPVQDARGNILGGASSGSEQLSRRETRKEMRSEVGMLEERFEKMMEIVEKNTEQISALADVQSGGSKAVATNGHNGQSNGAAQNGTAELSGHLERISTLLEQNSAYVASLAERQTENEQRMREMLEAKNARENSEQPDMSQLTSHLDRIQKLMERSTHGRKDSARDVRASPPRIDLSPLTFWLEKVLGAVEQNSELVKELLQEKEVIKQSSPGQHLELDLSPLSQRLDDLLDAQEVKTSRAQEATVQMNQRLDKIIDAQHKAVERGPFDVSLLSQRLDEILSVHRNAATVPLVEKLDQLVNAQKNSLDLTPVTHQLEELTAETSTLRDALDYSSLTEPLNAIRAATEQNSEHLFGILESQQTPEGEEDEEEEGQGDDAEPEDYVDHNPFDLEPLTEHLEALRAATEQNGVTMTELLETLVTNRQAVPVAISKSTISPFDDDDDDDRDNTHFESRRNESPGSGGTKFLISALTSHLSKIQAVTESNANAVRSTRESSHALQRSMTSAVSDTSSNIRALAAKHKDLAAQVAVREGQVREVVRTQAEMAESVRELAKAFKAQEKASCNHVVIPPPRKTNRKVVGFVYDAKDGRG